MHAYNEFNLRESHKRKEGFPISRDGNNGGVNGGCNSG